MSASQTGRTRIAPTPSGYLHVGNVIHIVALDMWAKDLGLDMSLRIDTWDTRRSRPHYVRDIFRVLRDLGITWTGGPATEAEAHLAFDPTPAWNELSAARDRGLSVFVCRCSRRTLASGAACECAQHAHTYAPHQTSLRLNALAMGLPATMHGTVLWRRDDLPAYHLMSVLSDRDMGITHVMRGEDLRPATQVQVALAPYVDAESFAHATFVHHPLVVDAAGNKLSKSAGAQAAPLKLPDSVFLKRAAAALLTGDG